jgi:hypothetical protein
MPRLARQDDGARVGDPLLRAMESSEMATFKKTYKPNEKAAPKGPPISDPSDTKRSFDARPKPSDDRRREERARPGQHIDQAPSERLLDSTDGDDSSED